MTDLTLDRVAHVVDDDASIRRSLHFLLEAARLRVMVYESASALLGRADTLEPGCIITDMRMPGMNGLELMRELQARRSAFPIIMLTGHADIKLAVEAMKLGAFEFLEKPVDDSELLDVIRRAMSVSQKAGVDETDRLSAEERIGRLSPRERDIFESLVMGSSNKVTAIRLNLSPRTVEVHRANIMKKMNAKNLSELVRMAIKVDMA